MGHYNRDESERVKYPFHLIFLVVSSDVTLLDQVPSIAQLGAEKMEKIDPLYPHEG
jgi:hypothetical protein